MCKKELGEQALSLYSTVGETFKQSTRAGGYKELGEQALSLYSTVGETFKQSTRAGGYVS
ncbi:unnamed protein product [Plutella xylostella]|uniref:(diamondback moth) hypothetical protein n=1 Tax=Plutella xylostella TaxID=51655 RepID=A0A8S4E4Q8_PLUXY|nr:unnamed protein product [Plutella xylostella]